MRASRESARSRRRSWRNSQRIRSVKEHKAQGRLSLGFMSIDFNSVTIARYRARRCVFRFGGRAEVAVPPDDGWPLGCDESPPCEALRLRAAGMAAARVLVANRATAVAASIVTTSGAFAPFSADHRAAASATRAVALALATGAGTTSASDVAFAATGGVGLGTEVDRRKFRQIVTDGNRLANQALDRLQARTLFVIAEAHGHAGHARRGRCGRCDARRFPVRAKVRS